MPHTVTRPPKLPVMIDLSIISTPREAAITVSLGEIDQQLITRAEEARVRTLPMVDDNGGCLGAISVKKLKELVDNGKALTAEDATVPCNILPYKVPVSKLLKLISAHGMVIHSGVPDSDEHSNGWFGIVSPADLNRPVFRSHIYQMLAILETALGRLIMDEFGDDWGAIRLLSDGTQRRIKEFYDEERAEGIDLSPVTNATLSDLFHIATESNNVWKLMEFGHPNELRPINHRINDLRNTIMHPVRPLLVNEKELEDVVTAVDDIEMLSDRLMKRIGVAEG